MKKLLLSFLIIVFGLNEAAFSDDKSPKLKSVPIHFLEALAPKDTTSSESFRKEFEGSINLGLELAAPSLQKCGFKLEPAVNFYNASDTLQAREKAEAAQKSETWLIVGPRRSNHYLLVANGANETPTVSLMASSSDVEKFGPLHVSAYASNIKLAEGAAIVASEKVGSKIKKYVSVVSEDCLVCREFSDYFDKSATQLKLKKLDEYKVTGDQPDVSLIAASIEKINPDFVVVPNYSQVSVQIISAITAKLPKVLFIGGDGWGDGRFGFVEKNPAVANAQGITVRGFPPTEIGLQRFPLGVEALNNKNKEKFIPTAGPGMAVMRIIQGTRDLLCKVKPKTRQEFIDAFKKSGRAMFTAPWGVSAYQLKESQISYWKDVSFKKQR